MFEVKQFYKFSFLGWCTVVVFQLVLGFRALGFGVYGLGYRVTLRVVGLGLCGWEREERGYQPQKPYSLENQAPTRHASTHKAL